MDIFLDELDNSSVESAENTIQDELIEQQLQNTTNDDLFEAEQFENIAPIADTSSSVPNIDTDSFGLDTDGSADIFKNADLADSIWGNVEQTTVNDTLSSEGLNTDLNENIFLPYNQYDVTLSGYENFMEIHGTPFEDLTLWDQQDDPNSCAVATTNMMFNSLGFDIGEDLLADYFQETGIYDYSLGTDPHLIDDVINDLATMANADFHATEIHGLDELTLKNELDAGNPLLVAIDAGEIYDYSPPGSGHAIQVTGIIETAGEKVVVINDPGFAEGAGYQVPWEDFMSAAAFFDTAVTVTSVG